MPAIARTPALGLIAPLGAEDFSPGRKPWERRTRNRRGKVPSVAFGKYVYL